MMVHHLIIISVLGSTSIIGGGSDLTPLDFFRWGFVKQEVYQEQPTTSQEMKNRIRNVFQTIRRETLSYVRETCIRRLNLYLEQNRQIVEHLVV
jgi:hypothetical protein